MARDPTGAAARLISCVSFLASLLSLAANSIFPKPGKAGIGVMCAVVALICAVIAQAVRAQSRPPRTLLPGIALAIATLLLLGFWTGAWLSHELRNFQDQ